MNQPEEHLNSPNIESPYFSRRDRFIQNQQQMRHKLNRFPDQEELLNQRNSQQKRINILNDDLKRLKTQNEQKDKNIKIYEEIVQKMERNQNFNQFVQDGEFLLDRKNLAIKLKTHLQEKEKEIQKLTLENKQLKLGKTRIKLQEKKKEIEVLIKEIYVRNEIIAGLNFTVNNLQNQLSREIDFNNNLSQQHQEIRREIDNQNDEQIQQNQQLQNQLNQQIDSNNKLSIKNQEIQSEIVNKNNIIIQKQQQLDQQILQNQQLQNKVNEQIEENQQLQNKVNEQIDIMSQNQQQLDQQILQNQKLQNKVNEQIDLNNNLSIRNKEIQSEIDERIQQNEQLQTTNMNLNQQLLQLKQELQKIEEENHGLTIQQELYSYGNKLISLNVTIGSKRALFNLQLKDNLNDLYFAAFQRGICKGLTNNSSILIPSKNIRKNMSEWKNRFFEIFLPNDYNNAIDIVFDGLS